MKNILKLSLIVLLSIITLQTSFASITSDEQLKNTYITIKDKNINAYKIFNLIEKYINKKSK
jgi:hypothetical protein